MEKQKQQELLLVIEKEVQDELKKTIETIKEDKTTETIEKIYTIPKDYAKMVGKGNARGFLLYGKAGIGKTYLVKRAFIEIGQEFVCLSGHITSLKLHEFLYENRKKHIILDDVNILENEKNLNLLKSALANDNNVVEYETTSRLLDVPSKFVFEGTITILLNSIPKGCESLIAVESRVLHHELILSYEQKIQVIQEIVKIKNYKDLKETERIEIFNWIKENTNEATENLSLRLLFTCYEFYRYDNKIWKDLAKEMIKTNEDLELIVQGLSEYQWCMKTGKHRATYFKYKKNLPKKTCVCGSKMKFHEEICETCKRKQEKAREDKRNKEYEANRKEREKKEKAKFIIWKRSNEKELQEQFEEQKAEFGDELDVEFDEFCEMSFQEL